MAEERITEKTDAQGNVIETTLERNDTVAPVTPITINTAPTTSSGGGMGGILTALLLLALAAGAYFLFVANKTESRKDDAVADAADEVGAAAEKAGNAIEKAVDKIDSK